MYFPIPVSLPFLDIFTDSSSIHCKISWAFLLLSIFLINEFVFSFIVSTSL
ncbi:hypothetical protein [Brachyspira aalborgi]|uniref:hypothetical protein n=1 Tax=Brachyspira aalborgi TaxID=29522 RepID=UPI002665D3CC|nr:hypothetical protein [Brachyspira aalborgi]